MSESTTSSPLDVHIRQLLSEALKVSLDSITPDLSFGDIPQWDSMGHMEIVMQLEEHFGIEINADTISALTSVAAIQDYLLNRTGGETL